MSPGRARCLSRSKVIRAPACRANTPKFWWEDRSTGEHLVEGLRCEAHEEMGIGVEVEGNPVLFATHTCGPEAWVLVIGFRARIVEGEPQPAHDVAGRRRIFAGEVDGTDFAWEHDREFVRSALKSSDER